MVILTIDRVLFLYGAISLNREAHSDFEALSEHINNNFPLTFVVFFKHCFEKPAAFLR